MSTVAPGFQTADVRREDFVQAPIPAGQVLDGQPRARSCALHASRQGGVSMNLWDCTAGRFRWHYPGDELIQLLEGEAHITDVDGTVRILLPGDTAHFSAGTSFVWEIAEYVKKLAIHRSPGDSAPPRPAEGGPDASPRLRAWRSPSYETRRIVYWADDLPGPPAFGLSR